MKKRKHKGLWQVLTGVLAALLLAAAGLLGYTIAARAAGNPLPTVFGWGSAVVLSGSMEPELPVGALLLIHREAGYEVGEIVTYEDNSGGLVTHRLVSLEGGEALTKGDANNAEDAPFPAESIRGRVRAVLPGVGSTVLWLKTPPGICAVLLIVGILFLIPRYIIRKVGKTHDEA